MKIPQQNFSVELVLRSPFNLTQPNRKYSADYRPRNHLDRKKDKDSSILSRRTNETYTPLLNKSKQIIESSVKNRQDYYQFADQCFNYINKKVSATSQYQQQHRRQEINAMFKNIKDVLKLNDKQERKQKEQKDSNKEGNKEGFLILRSQLQNQLYKSQDKTQFFKMSKTYESPQHIKNTRRNTSNRYLCSPFDNQTVACAPAQLHKPKEKDLTQLIQHSLIHNRQKSGTNRRVVSVSKPSLTKGMSFHLNGDTDCVYPKKIKSFCEFIFKVNYSNNLYLEINLSRNLDSGKKFKAYIGRGNNSILIKSLLRRRFWWQITTNINDDDINFYWSQNTIDHIHEKQLKSEPHTIRNSNTPIKKLKNHEEIYELNRKILPEQKHINVQKYIHQDGLGIPFEMAFIPDIETNHIPNNHCIGYKKNLFKSLYHYHTNITTKDPFKFIPRTYHIRSSEDSEFIKFQKETQNETSRIWIVKPGQNTNRGKAIRLGNTQAVGSMVQKSKHENGQQLTFIVQQYISKPLLYNGRKFDIRHFLLLTSINGGIKAYWYRDGYLRTSSLPFELLNPDLFVHLTNDAIQKKGEHFGRYEPSNKLSYSEFQRYMQFNHKHNFEKDTIPKMKALAIDMIKANYLKLDAQRLKNNFEVIGLDFMLDREYQPWLIQANYNPCLEVDCAVLERVIPAMLENTFRLTLDPLYPPTSHYPPTQRYYLVDNHLKNLKYELIFDQISLKEPIINDYTLEYNCFEEEEYADEGKQVADLQL